MTITLKSMLLDKRRLAAVFRQMTYAEKRHLAMSVADLFEKEIIQEQLKQQQQEKINAFLADAAKETGVPVEDVQLALVPRRRRRPAQPKYRFTDDKGFEHEWSGRGRMPRAMRDAIDSGMQLDDFAISTESRPRQRRRSE